MPTLFKREYKNHKVVNILPEVTEGYEWVLQGKGTPTVKIDGSCCAIIDGELYKRYDAKKGRKIPKGAISCGEPDPACSLYDDFKNWRKSKAKVVIKVNGNTVYANRRKSDNQK